MKKKTSNKMGENLLMLDVIIASSRAYPTAVHHHTHTYSPREHPWILVTLSSVIDPHHHHPSIHILITCGVEVRSFVQSNDV